MTQYALRETNQEHYHMRITLTATKPTDPPWEHVVDINSTNFDTRFEFTVRSSS